MIVDPHGNAEGDAGKDTLARTVWPLRSAFLCDIAIDRDAILAAVQFVSRMLDERKHGAPASEPVLLVIDEFSTLMRDAEFAKIIGPLLEAIASEGRKFLVFACLIGQQAHASRTAGGELKSIISSFYIHRCQPNMARILTGLPIKEFPDAFTMRPGEAYLVRTSGEIVRVRVPNTVPDDLQVAGGMLGGKAPGNQPVLTMETNNTALQSRVSLSAEEAEILHLFHEQDKDVAEIVRIKWPTEAEGRAYQKHAKEVQAVLRKQQRAA